MYLIVCLKSRQRVIGCEVWRAPDWMVDADKMMMDLSGHENLQMALLGVFDSQIAGGKRYDLASMRRSRESATYFDSHGVDETIGLNYGMDMTPLVNDLNLSPAKFVAQLKGSRQMFGNESGGAAEWP